MLLAYKKLLHQRRVITQLVPIMTKMIKVYFTLHRVQWLLRVPLGVAQKLQPTGVLQCSVWMSEGTTIISLYSIN